MATAIKVFDSNKIFLIFLSFRILIALFLCTFFSPDEFWQSSEVAYFHSFGGERFVREISDSKPDRLASNLGFVTWEWKYQIRGSLYPLIISTVFSVLSKIYLDYAWLVSRDFCPCQ